MFNKKNTEAPTFSTREIITVSIIMIAATIIWGFVARVGADGFALQIATVFIFGIALMLICMSVGIIQKPAQEKSKGSGKPIDFANYKWEKEYTEPTGDVASFKEQIRCELLTCVAASNFTISWASPHDIYNVILWKAGAKRPNVGKVVYSDDLLHVEEVLVDEDRVGKEKVEQWKHYRNIPYLAKKFGENKATSTEQSTAPPEADASAPTASSEATSSEASCTPTTEGKPSEADTSSATEPKSVPNTSGIPDEVVMNNVSLIWDKTCGKISTLADIAFDDGDESFVFEWPVYIRNEYMASLFADKLVSAFDGFSVKVNADKREFIVILPPKEATMNADVDADDGVADEMDAPTEQVTASEPEPEAPVSADVEESVPPVPAVEDIPADVATMPPSEDEEMEFDYPDE